MTTFAELPLKTRFRLKPGDIVYQKVRRWKGRSSKKDRKLLEEHGIEEPPYMNAKIVREGDNYVYVSDEDAVYPEDEKKGFLSVPPQFA